VYKLKLQTQKWIGQEAETCAPCTWTNPLLWTCLAVYMGGFTGNIVLLAQIDRQESVIGPAWEKFKLGGQSALERNPTGLQRPDPEIYF
jgi:hypothetical protein